MRNKFHDQHTVTRGKLLCKRRKLSNFHLKSKYIYSTFVKNTNTDSWVTDRKSRFQFNRWYHSCKHLWSPSLWLAKFGGYTNCTQFSERGNTAMGYLGGVATGRLKICLGAYFSICKFRLSRFYFKCTLMQIWLFPLSESDAFWKCKVYWQMYWFSCQSVSLYMWSDRVP